MPPRGGGAQRKAGRAHSRHSPRPTRPHAGERHIASRLLTEHLAHTGGDTCGIQTIVGKKLGRIAGLAEGREP